MSEAGARWVGVAGFAGALGAAVAWWMFSGVGAETPVNPQSAAAAKALGAPAAAPTPVSPGAPPAAPAVPAFDVIDVPEADDLTAPLPAGDPQCTAAQSRATMVPQLLAQLQDAPPPTQRQKLILVAKMADIEAKTHAANRCGLDPQPVADGLRAIVVVRANPSMYPSLQPGDLALFDQVVADWAAAPPVPLAR